MGYWTFKVYINERGDNEIEGWLASLSPKARAKIRRRFAYLAVTRIWIKKYAEKLKGYEDIYEIKLLIKIYNIVHWGVLGQGQGNLHC